MTKYDAYHPNGIEYPADNIKTQPGEIKCHVMTAEERERYGDPQPRKVGENVCPWVKEHEQYLDKKIPATSRRLFYLYKEV